MQIPLLLMLAILSVLLVRCLWRQAGQRASERGIDVCDAADDWAGRHAELATGAADRDEGQCVQ